MVAAGDGRSGQAPPGSPPAGPGGIVESGVGMGRIGFELAARVVAAGRRGVSRRRTTARAVNLSLFATLVLVFATGVGAVATGSAGGRWIVIAHGVVAFMVLLLIPWKTIVIRRGLRRRRLSRWVSLLLALMVVTTLVAGMVSVTGLVRSVGGFLTLWWHIAVALALVPLLLWHLISRPVRLRRMRLPRSPDLSRRAALRLGAVAGGAAVAYSVGEIALRLAGAPGAHRRFTGSHEVGSWDPAAMPVTSRLVRGPRLDRCARLGAPSTVGQRAQPVRALGHRVLGTASGGRRRHAAARHGGRRRDVEAWSRLPAAAGRARTARILVGEVGRSDRPRHRTAVVAAALPAHLTGRWPGRSARRRRQRPAYPDQDLGHIDHSETSPRTARLPTVRGDRTAAGFTATAVALTAWAGTGTATHGAGSSSRASQQTLADACYRLEWLARLSRRASHRRTEGINRIHLPR
jgi:hypothetical protein